jgi:FeS assembly SUF system protein
MSEEVNVPSLSTADTIRVDGESVYGDKVNVAHILAPGTDDWHASAVAAIRNVFDPEIPLNIYDLGLIYSIETLSDGVVRVEMTLTSPSCPEAESIPGRVETNLMELPDTKDVRLEMVWDPPWGPDRMSEEARLELGFY